MLNLQEFEIFAKCCENYLLAPLNSFGLGLTETIGSSNPLDVWRAFNVGRSIAL
jgi:hypothetical protein